MHHASTVLLRWLQLVRSHSEAVFSLPGSNTPIYISIKLIQLLDSEALKLNQFSLHYLHRQNLIAIAIRRYRYAPTRCEVSAIPLNTSETERGSPDSCY